MRAILIAILAIAHAAVAHAEESGGGVIRGVGTYSCGHFGKTYQSDPKVVELVYGSWAQGFMSGLNIQRALDGKPMRIMPAPQDGQNQALRRLCDQRPLADFFEIVVEYFGSLPEAKSKNSN